MIVTRFAPSPTGYLHLGHARSALTAYEWHEKKGARFLLRLEDIDLGRCRPTFDQAIREDLHWLGIRWPEPVRRQSEHMADYGETLKRLQERDLLYPCFCRRQEILAQRRRLGFDGQGPDGPLYPGHCRRLTLAQREERLAEKRPHALRLDMQKALAQVGPLYWQDLEAGKQKAEPAIFGDVVLARKDFPTSYHLAVTMDDHLQGMTHVIRGQDLFLATHIHRLLQELLQWNVPLYHHHPLVTDQQGQKLAKRRHSPTLRALRAEGVPPEEIRQRALAPSHAGLARP